MAVLAGIEDISIHAPHARSDGILPDQALQHTRKISIHAPHARSDEGIVIRPIEPIISIHAPHARSDFNFQSSAFFPVFQSTLLMRGAT